MTFYLVLSEAIAYQGKPLDLNNTLINFQYLVKLVCQVLVLQSISRHHSGTDLNLKGFYNKNTILYISVSL